MGKTKKLEKGRKYMFVLGDQEMNVLYRGSGDNPALSRLWPHEFITPYPIGTKASETKSVMSIRIREGGFNVIGNLIVITPDEFGRYCYSNWYNQYVDSNDPQMGITTKQRENMLEEMIEKGL